MSASWLMLVGISEDGTLAPGGTEALAAAEIVYGGNRHFELLGSAMPTAPAEQRTWPSPFSSVFRDLKALADRRVVILATGDPMWFGIGSSLLRHFPAEAFTVLPSPSAFQLAAARMRWSLQETETISLHGRPTGAIRGVLYPRAKVLALTSNGETPRQVADLLTASGFGQSHLTVLEHMGGTLERRVEGEARSWRATTADFHALAIDVIPEPGAMFLPRIAGLPDSAFEHDGKMTKQEVRAVTLAKLMPHPGGVLWDIGTGCGSIAIEWLRSTPNGSAIGMDPHEDRCAMARRNAETLGVPQLQVLQASAPDCLEGLAKPDAIFIGGGLTTKGVIDAAHAALRDGGRLVASAVTLESEAILLGVHEKFGGELTRIAIQRASPVGGLTGWRPFLPVTQWALIKGSHTPT